MAIDYAAVYEEFTTQKTRLETAHLRLARSDLARLKRLLNDACENRLSA